MKQTYKIVSILVILMLIGGIAVATAEPTNKGTNNARSNYLTKDAMNIDINAQNVVNSNQNSINVRQSKTPTTQYSEMFGMIDNKDYTITGSSCGGNSCWQSLTNFTFTLQKSAYVYVEASGLMTGISFGAVSFGIDESNPCKFDLRTMRLYTTDQETGFQTSKMYYLTAGTHTIYINGITTTIDQLNPPHIGYISINVLANEKGKIQTKN